MKQQIAYRIFVDNRPLENLSTIEREQFAERCVDQMGQVLNDYFGQHPEVYERMCKDREKSPVLQV